MPFLATSELRSDTSSACYAAARIVGQGCVDDIVAKPPIRGRQLGSQGTSSSTSDDNRFRYTRMCVFFQKGACTKGDKCTYAHSLDQLKSAPNLLKTRLCQDWLSGRCVTPNCRFAHGRQELRFTFDYYKTKLCHFWQTEAGCTKGPLCRHAHGEAELRPMPISTSRDEASSASTIDDQNAQKMQEVRQSMRPIPNSRPHRKPHSQIRNGSDEKALIGSGNKVDYDDGDGRISRPCRRQQPASPQQKHNRAHKKNSRSAWPQKFIEPLQPPNHSALSDAEKLAEAYRLAQAARQLADQSKHLIFKVAGTDTLDVSSLLYCSREMDGDDVKPRAGFYQNRHSVATPEEYTAAAEFDTFMGVDNQSGCRLWDQRHSAPDCDIDSLAEKLLPFLSGPQELIPTSKTPDVF